MQQTIFIDNININVTTNYSNKIASYQVFEHIGPIRDQYRVFTILNPNVEKSGLAIKVRKKHTSYILDFNVVNIETIEKLNTNYTKYFLKGEYNVMTSKFTKVSTGGQFNDKLIVDSADTLLTKNVLELIMFVCNQ